MIFTNFHIIIKCGSTKGLLMCSFISMFTTPLLCQVSRSSIAITHITHYFTLFLSLGCFVIISGDSKTTRSISICFKTLARKPRTLSDQTLSLEASWYLQDDKMLVTTVIWPNQSIIRANDMIQARGKCQKLLEQAN